LGGPRGAARAVPILAVAGDGGVYDLQLLLVDLDGLPLTIVLLAHQSQGESDLAGGRRRPYLAKRKEILRRGSGKERLDNLAAYAY